MHSTDVESPPSPRVCIHVHPEGESCSDLSFSACFQRPSHKAQESARLGDEANARAEERAAARAADRAVVSDAIAVRRTASAEMTRVAADKVGRCSLTPARPQFDPESTPV
jgi:hypothetical protein